MQLVDDVVHIRPAGDEVTVNEVTAAPPLLVGDLHETVEEPLALEVAVICVGAPGTVDGVAAGDGVEEEEVPDTLVAVTLKVYEVPLVRPVMVHESVGSVPVQVKPPGVDVTV